MKKLVLFLGITIAASAFTWALKAQLKDDSIYLPDKRYKVEMTIPEWEKTLSQIQWVQQQIKQSDMPSRNSIYCNDSILTPLVQQIFAQINAQVMADQKKAIQPKETTKTKKN